jgi:hypothetical protein
MQNAFTPLMNLCYTQLRASRRFADAIFAGTEKIDRAMINASHRVFNEQITLLEALATARDPRHIDAAFQSGGLSRRPNETINSQQEIMRIYAEMQNNIGRSFREYIAQLSAPASGIALPLSETMQPRTNDAAFNPVANMFSLWESAFKEVASRTKTNMATARSAVDEASETLERASNHAGAVSDMAAGVQSDTENQSIILSANTPADKRSGGKRK